MPDAGPMDHIYLGDSWVLAVETTDSEVRFLLDAVLEPQHPRFYSPPRPGERYAYARLTWIWSGEVRWKDGPHLDNPAIDAAGEPDFGNIDSWWKEGEIDFLEGEWGSVSIRSGRQSVEFANS